MLPELLQRFWGMIPVTLSQYERAEFVNSYTAVLIQAWSNEDYAARLEYNPQAALAEAGLELPRGATICISRDMPDVVNRDGVEGQVDLYEAGLVTGYFEFKVPVVPMVSTSELSDADLDSVAAGQVGCSCCPCCCAT